MLHARKKLPGGNYHSGLKGAHRKSECIPNKIESIIDSIKRHLQSKQVTHCSSFNRRYNS